MCVMHSGRNLSGMSVPRGLTFTILFNHPRFSPLDSPALKIQWLDWSDQHNSWTMTNTHWDLLITPFTWLWRDCMGFIDWYSRSITLSFMLGFCEWYNYWTSWFSAITSPHWYPPITPFPWAHRGGIHKTILHYGSHLKILLYNQYNHHLH